MKIIDTIKLAFKNAIRGKSKTFLCAIAVCVGVSSIYIMGEIASNAKSQIDTQIKKAGMGGIMIYAENEINSSLSAEKIIDLRKSVPELTAAMPIFIDYGECQLRTTRETMVLWGIDSQFRDIFSVELLHGRLPTAADVRAGAKVAVIEDTFAEKTYFRTNVVGKKLKLIGENSSSEFTVVGVITSQKSGVNALIGGDKLPSFVYAPYTAVQNHSGARATTSLAIACDEGFEPAVAAASAVKQLQIQQQGAKYKAENISGYVAQFSEIAAIISVVITLIGGITLAVGGIGVMNSMISAVDSRKKEIGIYLAIGAQKRDIVLCYLFEAIFICFAGGIAGALIGSLLLKLGAGFLGVQINLSFGFLVVTELLACVCGMLFGIIPAIKASNMNPIAAIRDEG